MGEGADGEVLTIQGDPNQVIKLSIIYDVDARACMDTVKNVADVLSYLINKKPPHFAKVSMWGYLGQYSREVSFGKKKQKFVMYFYIMEKLFPITEDEKKVFHSIVSHEDRGIEKNYSPEKIREMLQGMSRGLDFDETKITLFCQHLRQAHVLHQDIAVRNIMKNAVGEFKLVDMDRSILILPGDSA